MRHVPIVLLLLVASTSARAEEAPVPPDPDAVARTFMDGLQSDDPGDRFTAAVKLGRLARRVAVRPLLVVLEGDSDLFVRRAAARALGQIGDRGAVPGLIEALSDREIYVALEAAKALKALTGVSLGSGEDMSVEQRARIQKVWRAWWAKQTRAGSGGEVAKTPKRPPRPKTPPRPKPDPAALVERLSSDTANVRFCAAVELGKLRHVRAVTPLGERLASDDDYFVRRACARALGEIRRREGVPALIAALTDGEVFVAAEAARALKRITGRDPGLTKTRDGRSVVVHGSPKERREIQAGFRAWWEKARSEKTPPERGESNR